MSDQAKELAPPSPSKPKLSELPVESIMVTDVFVLTTQMNVRDAIALVLQKKISGAPLVDNFHKLVSVVSESDLLRFIATPGLDKPLASCLDKLPKLDKIVTAKKSDSILDVYKNFLHYLLHRVVVVDGNGKVLGLVSCSSILRAVADYEN